jgi:hypothetical protein
MLVNHMYSLICMYMCIHTCIHMYAYAYIIIPLMVWSHLMITDFKIMLVNHMYIYMPSLICIYIYTCVYICIYMYTHMYTYAYTYILMSLMLYHIINMDIKIMHDDLKYIDLYIDLSKTLIT